MTYRKKVNFLRKKMQQFNIKNFTVQEILRGWDVPEEYVINIIPTLRVLQAARDYFGIPFYILSTYRDKEYNAAVGGKKNSLHLVFNAIDFTVKNYNKLNQIYKFLDDSDKGKLVTFTYLPHLTNNLGIGIYDSFIHLDTRSILNKKTPARWDERKNKPRPIAF